jgi:hypothetical protein
MWMSLLQWGVDRGKPGLLHMVKTGVSPIGDSSTSTSASLSPLSPDRRTYTRGKCRRRPGERASLRLPMGVNNKHSGRGYASTTGIARAAGQETRMHMSHARQGLLTSKPSVSCCACPGPSRVQTCLNCSRLFTLRTSICQGIGIAMSGKPRGGSLEEGVRGGGGS